MQSLFKVSVLLLLAAMLAAPLAVPVLASEFSPDQRPAGCHRHTTPLPEPGPTSHSCCQGGHYPAIVQQGSAAHAPLQPSAQLAPMPDSASPPNQPLFQLSRLSAAIRQLHLLYACRLRSFAQISNQLFIEIRCVNYASLTRVGAQKFSCAGVMHANSSAAIFGDHHSGCLVLIYFVPRVRIWITI